MSHVPVLFNETIDLLKASRDKIIVDGTLGRGGHTKGFLQKGAKVIAFDQDLEAINEAVDNFQLEKTLCKELKIYQNEDLTVVHANFTEMTRVLNILGLKMVDGVFLDLGVSSPQFDNPKRGFSYRFDAKLDMRMDQTQTLSAWDIINSFDQKDIFRIIKEYGEEQYAKNIAREIVKARPINTTFELIEVIRKAMPLKSKQDQHPAKRTFQALRIAVNDELNALKKGLIESTEVLNPGGRIGVIAFHSLEDRIVKEFFREQANPCTCPKNLPCICHKNPTLKIITKRPVTPSGEKLEANRRSHSSKLRVAEKITIEEGGK